MSRPRQIVPGTTYFLTRRCAFRTFFLRPSRETNLAFLYVLATAAQRFSIQIHAFCVMSNHWHCVLTDPEGQAPLFMEFVHMFVAKIVNTALGRSENVWSSEAPSLIALQSRADILAKVCYTLANPVAAGLVAQGRDWPGLRIGADHLEVPLVVKRPRVFFRENGHMPGESSLVLSVPPGWPDLDQYKADVVRGVTWAEEQGRMAQRVKGHGFLGRRKVLRQSPRDTPTTWCRRFGLKPKVVAKSRRLRRETIHRMKEFLDAYRAALLRWKQGARDVVFPFGTYALRVRAGVICAGPD